MPSRLPHHRRTRQGDRDRRVRLLTRDAAACRDDAALTPARARSRGGRRQGAPPISSRSAVCQPNPHLHLLSARGQHRQRASPVRRARHGVRRGRRGLHRPRRAARRRRAALHHGQAELLRGAARRHRAAVAGCRRRARERRLDSELAYVRLEIAIALAKGILVVPLLIKAARMPLARDLPPSIAALATSTRRSWPTASTGETTSGASSRRTRPAWHLATSSRRARAGARPGATSRSLRSSRCCAWPAPSWRSAKAASGRPT